MPFKTKEELEKVRQNLHSVIWPLVSDFDNKNWKSASGTEKEKTGIVYKGSHDKIGTVWKVEAVLDISAEEYYQRFIKDGELLDWVPDLNEFKILERSDGVLSEDYSWQVNYQRLNGRGAISSRDFVSIDFSKPLGDGSFLCLTIATEHPNGPKTSGSVRGEYLPSATLVRPWKDDPKRCELFWINNVDLKGFMLRSVVNFAMSGFMQDFGNAVIGKCKSLAAKKP